MDYVGLHKKGRTLAGHLAYGDQRRLEVARALATEPKLLALDEPVAGMNPSERRRWVSFSSACAMAVSRCC
jgi:branched-chain amino acid transport system ATP-binding protein